MYANNSKRTRTIRFVTAALAAAVALTMGAAVLTNVTAQAATTSDAGFRSRLAVGTATEKFAAMTDPALGAIAVHQLTETPIAPPAPVVVTPRTTTRSTGTTSASASTGGTQSAPAAAPAVDENAEAQAILAGLIAKYPILEGTTVSFGDAKGSQAIAYYKSGRIVISPTHTASLSRILNHEVWHIIDWRDNGVIDWGENVPPQQ